MMQLRLCRRRSNKERKRAFVDARGCHCGCGWVYVIVQGVFCTIASVSRCEKKKKKRA